MQTRPIRRLAEKLRSTYRISKSWRVTANLHHVLTPDRELNPGLAKVIAKNRYMPGAATVFRLRRDGAIEPEPPQPLKIDGKTRRAIIRALEERKPLPSPTPRVVAAFESWLETRAVRR